MNKIEKRFSILVLGLILITGNLLAQPGQRPQHPPKIPDSAQISQMVDDLSVTLSLTDGQKSKISDLYTNHFAELKTKMENNKAINEKQREIMDNFRKNFEERVKAVLTDEQDEIFEIFLKDHRPIHDQKRKDKRN